MFNNGTIATLINSKSHGEGEDAVTLSAGTCGMVVQGERQSGGEYMYVVDFGAYGQWYCLEGEISAQESSIRDENFDDDLVEAPRRSSEPVLRLIPAVQPIFDDETGEEIVSPIIDVDADIKRRMKEIEEGVG